MNRTQTLLLAVTVVVAGLLAACNEQKPVSTPIAQVPELKSASVFAAFPAASWPPAAPANLAVAVDLFADNYVLVLDDSGSMGSFDCGAGKSRMAVAKDGSIKFGKSLPTNANLGLVILNVRHGLQLGTGNRLQFEKAVSGTKAIGGTPLVGSITRARDMLTEQAQKQRGYGTYHMVVVTDGESGDGNPAPLAKEIVAKTAINVHVIGFCVDNKHSLYLPGYTRYASALNPQMLDQGLKAVLVESEIYVDSSFILNK